MLRVLAAIMHLKTALKENLGPWKSVPSIGMKRSAIIIRRPFCRINPQASEVFQKTEADL
jgi:hypothetical protein